MWWGPRPWGLRGDHHLMSPSYHSVFLGGGVQTPHARRTPCPQYQMVWGCESYN